MPLRILSLGAILIVCLGSSLAVAADFCHFGWSFHSTFNGYRYRHGGGVNDGQLYIWGGTTSAYKRKDLQVYDPAADQWTALLDMPDVKANFGFAVAGGYLYAIGGEGPISRETRSYRYDLLYGTWTTIANYPADNPVLIGMVCSDADGSTVYCFGGMEPSAIIPKPVTIGFVYSPDADEWTPIADLPAGLGFGYAAYYQGRIYATGGYPMEDETYAFDPVNNVWETLPSPSARHAPVLSAAGELLWLAGGGDVWDESIVADQYFDFNSWSDVGTSFNPPRIAAVGGYIPGFGIFVAGGVGANNEAGSDDTFLWHICVPHITAVEPAAGTPGTPFIIAAETYEATVTGYLYDETDQVYPIEDYQVVDATQIQGQIPSDLPAGTYGLALIGSLGQIGRFDAAFTIPGDDDTADDDQADDDQTDDDQSSDDDNDDDSSDDDNDNNDDGGGCGC